MGETGVDTFHGVRFYDSAESMGAIVAAFLGTGFVRHETALVVATPAHHHQIALALGVCGFNVDSLRQSDRLVLLDASDTLEAVSVHHGPDPVKFEGVLRRESAPLRRGGAHPMRAYDEMGDMLWKRRSVDAALRLESLWDRWTATHDCSLLCGHAVSSFGDRTGPRAVCELHTHVVAENGLPHLLQRMVRPSRLRGI